MDICHELSDEDPSENLIENEKFKESETKVYELNRWMKEEMETHALFGVQHLIIFLRTVTTVYTMFLMNTMVILQCIRKQQ